MKGLKVLKCKRNWKVTITITVMVIVIVKVMKVNVIMKIRRGVMIICRFHHRKNKIKKLKIKCIGI
jgi:hypothetical protein